jgi:glycosyltransferase involved in cell wall biosynthesis
MVNSDQKNTLSKNVLFIHQAFVTPNEGGGTRHYEICSYCVEQGYNFYVIGSDANYMTGKITVSDHLYKSNNKKNYLKIIRAQTFKVLHKSFLWRIVAFLSFMFSSLFEGLKTKNIDLVMGTTPPIFQTVSSMVLAKIKNKPFLLEVRDLWPDFAIDMGVLKNPILIRLSKWLEKLLYKEAIHIVVNSPAYVTYLIEIHHIRPDKVTLIPNGVDITMFEFDVSDTSHISKSKLNGKFIVTYAGALGMANDIYTILRAAKILSDDPDIHFLLVGDGKEKNKIVSEIQKMELSNVSCTGVVPKTEMKQILSESNVCIATLKNIPMFKMTYPNKVFDYMAAGRATILGIEGVIKQVVLDAKAGICTKPGNENDIVDAVKYLKSNEKMCEKMGSDAREYVKKHFDRQKHASAFCDLVTTLIQKNK